MAEIIIGGVTLRFNDSAFTAAQWEQVASWVLNGGGESAAENARIALQAASEAAKAAANADEGANSAKSYSVGGTGTREGEDTDNAKFYCKQAHAIAGEGMVFSVNGQQADEVGNVNVTKDNIGLDKVNNTADTEKPVSFPQQQALDELDEKKAALLHAAQHETGGSDPLTPEGIGAGRVNPNILHNWYFGNPVNQRGFSSYSYDVPRYTIDRWKSTEGSIFLDLTQTGCISITSEHGTTYLRQYLDGVQAGTYTASALVKSVAGTPNTLGTYGALFVGDGDVVASVAIKEAGLYSFTFTNDTAIKTFNLQTNFGNTIEIIAVKLELGTQQTLAHQDADGNWVLNEIPDYGEQLALCQRYYVKLPRYATTGLVTTGATVYYMPFYLPVPMRTAPVVGGTPRWRGTLTSGGMSAHTDASYINFTSAAVSQYSDNSNMFFVTDTITKAKDPNNTTLFFELSGVEFSADL